MSIKVRHGNTLDILLDYTVDGEAITEGSCDELEFTFGESRYTLTGGGIVWSAYDSAYMVSLTQEETFALPDVVKYQLRVKKGNKVGGSDISYLNVDDSLSQEVL